MFREGVTLYPINPKQSASYRDSYTNAGCKSDVVAGNNAPGTHRIAEAVDAE